MTTGPIREPALAKVNLFLHIVGKRADGYHLLDSLAVFTAVGDWVTAFPSDTLTLAIEGPFGAGLAGEADNLVLKAARALANACGVAPAARLVLDKHLPVASGIGGGSADAAATLRALSRLWNITLPPSELARIALALGADVPVCLASVPARMGGVGEALQPAPALPECGIVLVNPGVAVATAAVFRSRAPGFSAPAEVPGGWADAQSMAAGLAGTTNDLEPPARALCPEIGDVLDALNAAPGCLLARMSGSGATCFALTATPEAAASLAAQIARPGWWRWGGALSKGLPDQAIGP